MLPSFSSVLPEYSNVTHDDIVQVRLGLRGRGAGTTAGC